MAYLPWLLLDGFLLFYLWFPWFQRKLGAGFLPLALIVQSAVLMLRYSLIKTSSLLEYPMEVETISRSWQLFVFLFIPLILTSWQYRLGAVFLFCLLTGMFDLLLLLPQTEAAMLSRQLLFSMLFLRTLLYLVVGYIIAQLMSVQRAQRVSLSNANAQLSRYNATLERLAESRERNRLAHELHDTLAHTLTALIVQLEATSVVLETDQVAVPTMLDHSIQIARSGLVETRRGIQALRAAPLEELGLALALRELAVTTAKRAGLDLDLHIPPELPQLNGEVEQCIYRVAEEALTNIVRHARAKRAVVTLEPLDEHSKLTVSDDGRGFDAAALEAGNHFGIRGMRERAEMINAKLDVLSGEGRGTSVVLAVNHGNHSRSDL